MTGCFVAEFSQHAMNEEDSICLSVLNKNIESIELQVLAEKHSLQSNLDLEQSQRDALQDVETQLAECQGYVDQLELTPDRLQAYLPNLNHQVGRLQRTFHTIQSINPELCEGSTVPSNIQRLINHLQRLEGRLEVIPEEDTTENSEAHDMQQWQRRMEDVESGALQDHHVRSHLSLSCY